MALSPTSPLTGGAQADLTSPTYTLVSDTAPNAHSKQWYVSALGGTQTGVTTHTVGSPFTLTVERPAQLRQIGSANPVTGVISNIPNNVYTVRVRHGATPAVDQSTRNVLVETRILVPAGTETYDTVNVQAAISLLVGALSDLSSSLGSTAETGSI
jgi:hypothetical protein